MPTLLARACDCHVHVFGPDQFPYAPQRAYTPAAARSEALEAVLEGLGMQRVVVVQPSVYGHDNRCLLNALEFLGTDRARGIAVIHPQPTSASEIARLHEGGVRGLRLNLQVSGESLDSARQLLQDTAQLIRRTPGWHLQVHATLSTVDALLEAFERLQAPVVLDHYAGGLTASPSSLAHLDRLLKGMARAPIYVKLSAPYRLQPEGGLQQAAQLARAFAEAAPTQILWGSDWPHTGGHGTRAGAGQGIEPFRDIDNRQVLQELLNCMPDDNARQQLLVHNPAALYGFTA